MEKTYRVHSFEKKRITNSSPSQSSLLIPGKNNNLIPSSTPYWWLRIVYLMSLISPQRKNNMITREMQVSPFSSFLSPPLLYSMLFFHSRPMGQLKTFELVSLKECHFLNHYEVLENYYVKLWSADYKKAFPISATSIFSFYSHWELLYFFLFFSHILNKRIISGLL